MKEFWSSCAAIVIITIAAVVILGAMDMSSESVFTTMSVRH